ncbi:MAG: OmpA family protein [Chitinophagaceae bacterium]
MKNIFSAAFILIFFLRATAQITDPNKAVQNAATNKANSEINAEANAGVNKADNAIRGLFKKKKNENPAANNAANSATAATPQSFAQTQPSMAAYNNYDFVPGDKIVFEDNFQDDQPGEFPAHWNLGKGQGVMNNVSGKNALLLTEGNFAHVSPLIKSTAYLKDSFTIEFDNYAPPGGYGPHLYFYKTVSDAAQATRDIAQVDISHGNIWSAIMVEAKSANVQLVSNYPDELNGKNYSGRWHHIAIAYKANQLKVYVDQYRVITVPNLGVMPGAFDIEGIGSASLPIVVSNIRIANGGGMNLLAKKFTDEKIITHGINFDIDKATIKPESMGTLNMIAGIMKNNPDLRFEVDGHTDNTGTAPHNLTLSQQRADAVKQQLVNMGIDAARLASKGFGDSKPMSDNSTPEGKANNRRVEFVKQ